MATYSTIKIHLQPHVAKYLETVSRLRKHLRQGVDDLPKEAVYFDSKSHEGRMILSFIEANNQKNTKQYRLDSPFTFMICDKYRPDFDSRYYFLTISNKHCKMLNDLIKTHMISKLYAYVVSKKDEQKEMNAIRAWLLFYGIDEDVLSFEAAKKWLYRSKKTFESLEPQLLEVN